MPELPDVLVCGVGGALGEAWMRGLLNGMADGAGLDLRRCEHFVGSSAGSIVTAVLAAGERPDAGARAAAAWGDAADGTPEPVGDSTLARSAARAAGRAGAAMLTPVVPLALAATAPGGALVRAAALRAVPRGRQQLDRLGELIEGLGSRFDGRLRIAAVDRARGRRVLFGAPGAPPARVREAVLASCAVPAVFPPVRIGDREYVDGGVWSPTNLDAAPVRRGAHVVCLNPTASLPASSRALSALRTASRAAARAEALALRARGAEVELITPDAASAATMSGGLMNARNRAAVLAAGYAQGRRAP